MLAAALIGWLRQQRRLMALIGNTPPRREWPSQSDKPPHVIVQEFTGAPDLDLEGPSDPSEATVSIIVFAETSAAADEIARELDRLCNGLGVDLETLTIHQATRVSRVDSGDRFGDKLRPGRTLTYSISFSEK